MSDFVIMTDSSCDLPLSVIEEFSIVSVPLIVRIDDKEYRNFADESEITCKEFYNYVRNGASVSTSATNLSSYTEVMEPILKEGKDILCISFSSGLSNTYNASKLAAEDMREAFPDRKIFVVDSLCASLGQGLLVYLAAKKKAEGKSIEEVNEYTEETKLKICHWFTVDDLHHLKRGGRISATTEVIGSVLKIKPVLNVDNEGHLINVGKARGRKLAIKALIDKICESAVEPEKQTMFISHGDCYEEAAEIANELKARTGVKEVIINYVGPVIGAHTGAGVLALFCVGNER